MTGVGREQPVSFQTHIVGKRTSSLGRSFDSYRPIAVIQRHVLSTRVDPKADLHAVEALTANMADRSALPWQRVRATSFRLDADIRISPKDSVET
jgi:hypothetical protein